MANPLEVDPEKLAKSSSAFDAIAGVADRIAAALRGGVDAAGDYAGTGSFADAYNRLVGPGITGLVDSLRGLSNGMAATAGKIKDSADLYNKSDQVNGESVPRLPADHPVSSTPAPKQVKGPRG